MNAPFTPWNPDPRAVAKVRDVLPLPKTCPCCSAEVQIVPNEKIFGRSYGKWPWIVFCFNCRASTSLHPFTGIPMGIMADKPTREARMRAKDAFNTLWLDPGHNRRGLTRRGAYSWLAFVMGIKVEQCHIGWFTREQAEQVVAIIDRHGALGKDQLQLNLENRIALLSTKGKS